MFEGITKNWKTSSFGVLLILLGFYLLHEHNEQIETAIGLIIGGLSQLFAKDGATKSEYIKEKEEIKTFYKNKIDVLDSKTRDSYTKSDSDNRLLLLENKLMKEMTDQFTKLRDLIYSTLNRNKQTSKPDKAD
jgi:hypothetical protein